MMYNVIIILVMDILEHTAVSSAGTNASNNGIFEYDVPKGLYALSTKGLNSF